MFTLILSALLTVSTTGHANPLTAERFERRLRQYFAGFAGGRDIVGAIHFTNEVRSDLDYHFTQDGAERDPEDPDAYMRFEVAYITVLDQLLCRVGVGKGATLTEFHILPVVEAQCVPMTGEQLRYGVSDLVAGYREARAVFHDPARNTLIARMPPTRPLRAFDQRQLAPRIESRIVFFLTRSVEITNPTFQITARTRTSATDIHGATKEGEDHYPIWTFAMKEETARVIKSRACGSNLTGAGTVVSRRGGGKSII